MGGSDGTRTRDREIEIRLRVLHLLNDAVKQVALGENQSDRLVRSIGARLAARRGLGTRAVPEGSVRFQPPNLHKTIGEAVGEMCPYPAPATQKGPGNRAFLLWITGAVPIFASV
jgi:hypothetical protein